jgi:hypothetical protein
MRTNEMTERLTKDMDECLLREERAFALEDAFLIRTARTRIQRVRWALEYLERRATR